MKDIGTVNTQKCTSYAGQLVRGDEFCCLVNLISFALPFNAVPRAPLKQKDEEGKVLIVVFFFRCTASYVLNLLCSI